MVISTPEEMRKYRKRVGLSQTEVAKMAGCSQSLIARIEKGGVDPRLSTFNNIKNVIKEVESKNTEGCIDLMSTPVIYASPDDTVSETSDKFIENNISQMPVVEEGKQIGCINESNILNRISYNVDREKMQSITVREVMGPPFPVLNINSNLNDVLNLLKTNKAIIITTKGEIDGIITKSDIIDLI